ncbi:MAG: YceI family protein [Ignavibacteriaceae bacterium]|nr:YceI family protein [Ignavibacteriaceae bacterium]
MKQFLAGLFTLLITFSLNAQTEWSFDKSHSNVKFTVTHLMISEVDGFFSGYEGKVITQKEGNLEGASIEFSIDVNTINTDNDMRDKHLKSDDFFNSEKFPKITFKSSKVTKSGDNKYKVTGNLTMRDVTKEVTLDVNYLGSVKDPYGNMKAGYKVSGSVNRFDYGLKWNTLTELGGSVVDKTVNIAINAQLVQKK